MKKLFTLTIFAIVFSLITPVFAQTDLTGKVVKLAGGSTLYYITETGELYVFPNEKTYKTWFNDFSEVLTVTQEELSPYMPPVGNVHYRPGILLVKIQTDPKVYAISTNGILRWIKTEKLAKRFYGEDWNKIIEDIPAGFFINYQVGDDIDDDNDFNTDKEVEDSDTIDRDHHGRGQKNDNRGKKFAKARKAHSEIRGKTRVCHNVTSNPHTISINNAALPAHLAHGDTVGPCKDDDDNNNDVTAPVISNINSANATTTAVITWTTNEKSTSKVTFNPQPIASASSTSNVSSGSLVTAHSVNLTGLTASTTYYFIVESTDSSNNTATSTQHSFTTTIPVIDTTAPIISNIVATSTTSTTTAITWKTNELANGKVVYANQSLATASTTSTVFLNTLLLQHTFSLTGLTASTTYYFIVNSADTIGNSATSSQQMFTTPL